MNFGGFRWIRWTSGVPLNLPLNLSFLVYIKYSVFHSSDVCRWLPVVLQNIIKPHMTQTHSKPTLTWQSAGLQEWETDWLMEFNPFKCEAITFTRPISAVSVSFERRTTVRPVFYHLHCFYPKLLFIVCCTAYSIHICLFTRGAILLGIESAPKMKMIMQPICQSADPQIIASPAVLPQLGFFH